MSNTARRNIFALTTVFIFAAAIGLRLVPLHWSPLPATLDGFSYASLVEETITAAHLPFDQIHSDEIVYTLTLAFANIVMGEIPLHTAQVFTAFVGAGSALTAAAIAGRIGRELGWQTRQTLLAAALSGFGIAVGGLYVRRTGVPDEEAMGLLLVPLCALAVHRTLLTGKRSWLLIAGLLIGIFPLVHNMSAIVALLTITSVLALHSRRWSSRRALRAGGFLVGGFWIYFWGYYELAARFGLGITYQSVIGTRLGLFVAWIIVLVGGARWLRNTSGVVRQSVFLLPFVLGFGIISANIFRPIFPGTVPSPPSVITFVSLYAIPTLLAVGILGRLLRAPTGTVAFSFFLAPAALAYYTLTAGLTPAFFDVVLRVQTFAHPAVFILAGLTVAALVGRSPHLRSSDRPDTSVLRTAVTVLFVISILGTVPLAYVNLDTGTYPSTTTQSEFQAATFATTHLNQQFATADPIGRITSYYYGANESQKTPTRQWLTGGSPPACPTVSRQSWTQAGAHLYPAAPESMSSMRYQSVIAQQNLIYSSNGLDPIYLTLPRNDTDNIC